MSDEYASSGFKGSLVNESAAGGRADDAYATGNYPSEGDSTSSGGYGAGQSSWSTDAQRGRTDAERASAAGGLIDQSTSGGGLSGALQDAQQGRDTSGAPGMAGAQGLDPYGKNPDSREEVAEMLAHGSADRRGEQFESGPAGSVEQGNLGA